MRRKKDSDLRSPSSHGRTGIMVNGFSSTVHEYSMLPWDDSNRI